MARFYVFSYVEGLKETLNLMCKMDYYMLKKFSVREFAFNAFKWGEVLSYQQWVLSTFVISSLQLRFCLESNKLSFRYLKIWSCKSVCRSIKCLHNALVEGGKLSQVSWNENEEVMYHYDFISATGLELWMPVLDLIFYYDTVITLMMSWRIQENYWQF